MSGLCSFGLTFDGYHPDQTRFCSVARLCETLASADHQAVKALRTCWGCKVAHSWHSWISATCDRLAGGVTDNVGCVALEDIFTFLCFLLTSVTSVRPAIGEAEPCSTSSRPADIKIFAFKPFADRGCDIGSYCTTVTLPSKPRPRQYLMPFCTSEGTKGRGRPASV